MNDSIPNWAKLKTAEWKRSAQQAREAAVASRSSHAAYIAVADSDIAERGDGALAGVPFAVKDNIDVAGFATTSGTPWLAGAHPEADAGVVSALRDEGAIVVGKTNMHELAFGITSNNAEFGAVRNPHDTARSAGGSSGGSAATVALGTVPFSLGTDTGGSMTIPASMCGVVGFRPTRGRYPGDGVVNLSLSRDTVGVHANSVADVGLVDRVITRQASPPPRAASQLRIGVPAAYLDDLDEEVEHATRDAIDRLSRAGVEIVTAGILDAFALAGAEAFDIVFYECVRGFEARVAQLGAPFARLTLAEMTAGTASPDVRGILSMLVDSPVDADRYEKARRARWHLRRAYEGAFSDSGLDAFLFPSAPVLAPPIGEDDVVTIRGVEHPIFPTVTRHAAPGSFAGVPMISVPAGASDSGLPIGVTLEGRFFDDVALLGVASEVESILSS